MLGGIVPTALTALERLGISTTFITSIGDDWLGKKIIKELRKENIDCSAIKIVRGKPSPFSFIQVKQKSGERAISFFPGSSKSIELSESAKEMIKSSNILHLDGYNPIESIKAAKYAIKYGTKVSLDVNIILEGTKELLSYVNYLIIPETFLFEYTKSENIEYSFKKMKREISPDIFVVTFGSKGSIALVNNETIRINAFKVKVKDTTGAGDAYHGAFLFGIINGWRIEDIMIFASAVSAINCMSYGGSMGIPNYEETIKFLSDMGICVKKFKPRNINL